MALLANQIMDARLLSSMNGREELSHFLRVTNHSIASQANSPPDDNLKNRKYPCPLCGKRFRFNSILSLHMRTHTGEKPFKCPYCDHRAAQKGNLKIHLRTHKQGILGKGRGRVREENRLLHELEERAILRDRQMKPGQVAMNANPKANQDQDSPVFQTVLNSAQFLSETSSHTSTSPVASIQDEPIAGSPPGFRCSFCKGKFRKQQELDRHIRILHKPYKCTLCDFAASQEEELIGHVETAHITADQGAKAATNGSSEKSKSIGEYPCEVCGQTFSQAWFLKGHMRKHKDSFEHCCQICGRRFKEPWFLKNHMKVHLNKLAAKSNHSEHPSIGVLTQEHRGNIYSQYMARIHDRFISDREQNDYNNMIGVDIKVREMLQRMASPSAPMADLESLNRLHSSLSLEYLQKVVADNSRSSGGGGGGGGGYSGWQVMTPGMASDQGMFASHQGATFPPEDGDSEAMSSRPNSTDEGPLTEIMAETGTSGSSLEHTPQSTSPTAGERTFRSPPSAASLGFPFSPWQSPPDPSSTSPPKPRPSSRDFSSTSSPFLGLDGDSPPRRKTTKDLEPSLPKKSQFEPLDLSVKPDSLGFYANGLSPNVTRRLQTYAFEGDRKVPDGVDRPGFNGEAEKPECDDDDESAKWLKNDLMREVASFRSFSESPIASLESLNPGQALSLQHHVGLLSFLRSQASGLSPASSAAGNVGAATEAASARKPFQCRYCPYSASQKGNLKTHVLCVHRKPFDNSLYPDRRLRRSHAPLHRPPGAPRPPGPPRLTGLTGPLGLTGLTGLTGPQGLQQNHLTGDQRGPAGLDLIGLTSLCGT